jgi:DeoR family transcriptional regulator, glycerol-3-phosphate regulon repressor
MTLTPNPRQRELLESVRLRRSASVDELAQQLGVTPQTVRRDAQALADAGLLARFHGGVGMPESTTENIGYAQRQALNAEGKRRIAQRVAHLVPDGTSLFINIGTTTEEIARALLKHRDLRVVTNNLNVAAILSESAGCEVIVAGGTVRARDRGIVGEAAIDFLRQFRVDLGLIGISSIEEDGTLRDFDLREVKVARAIIEQSRAVWLCADHTKFTRQAMVELGPVTLVDALVTDAEPAAPMRALLQKVGVRCEVAVA